MDNEKDAVAILLDSLDISVNSNKAWLYFNVYKKTGFNISRFLTNQLSSGYFHRKLIVSDVERGWEY